MKLDKLAGLGWQKVPSGRCRGNAVLLGERELVLIHSERVTSWRACPVTSGTLFSVTRHYFLLARSLSEINICLLLYGASTRFELEHHESGTLSDSQRGWPFVASRTRPGRAGSLPLAVSVSVCVCL